MAHELGELEPVPELAPGPIRGRAESAMVPLLRMRPLATAAVLAAAACVAALLVAPRDPLVQKAPAPWPTAVQPRTESSGPVLRLLVPDGQTLTRDRFVLRWHIAEAARFDVRVMTTDLDEVVAATDLTATQLHVAAEELAQLREGTTLLWQVEAHLPDGERILSPTFRARLK